ncbi:hypothetical protein AB0L06_37355 [Spirillospora sp. NPDC052269]
MSYYVEWERLAHQAYEQLSKAAQAEVARAVIAIMREGVPDSATPDGEGSWHLRAGDHVIGFTISDDLDVYLYEIERA